MVINPRTKLVRLASPEAVAARNALGEVPKHIDEVVVAVLNLLLELPQRRRVLAEEVWTVEEEPALLVILMALHHVIEIQAEGLIFEKSSVKVSNEMSSPLCHVADLAADRIVQISDAARKQPGVGIHENLIRGGKLTFPRQSMRWGVQIFKIENSASLT